MNQTQSITMVYSYDVSGRQLPCYCPLPNADKFMMNDRHIEAKMDISTFVTLSCLCIAVYAFSDHPLPVPYRIILTTAACTLVWNGLKLASVQVGALVNSRVFRRFIRFLAG